MIQISNINNMTRAVDNNAVQCLIYILTNGPPGHLLDGSQAVIITDILLKLGSIASSNDLAFTFLKESIRESYWKTNRMWRWSDIDDTYVNHIVGIAIIGIAVSLRPEAVEMLENLVESEDLKYKVYHSGAIIDAFYNIDVIRRLGREKFLALDLDERMAEFQRWLKTAEGQRRRAWDKEVNRLWIGQEKRKKSEP